MSLDTARPSREQGLVCLPVLSAAATAGALLLLGPLRLLCPSEKKKKRERSSSQGVPGF